MKINNKKGFTLVELLAVLVVLAVIVLLAVNIINSRVKDARKNSVEVNANNYIKAVNGVAAISQNVGEDMEKGTYQVRDLNKQDIKISGEKPRKGYLVLENYEVTYGCLMYDNYSAVISNGKTSSVDKLNCNDFKVNAEFAYKGSEEVFNVQISGLYKIEVWGAQGGNSHDPNVFGGYGGYSVGYIDLKKNDKLYINVGEQGQNVTTDILSTSYNGGASCRTDAASRSCGNGGGATSVALKSGQLKNLTNSASDIVIVAGGGGGASTHDSDTTTSGGSGGGYIGSSGSSARWGFGTGGTQSDGGARATTDANAQNGSFGLGGNGALNAGAGGGGGYYGGGGGHGGSGGGGSGYIGNGKLLYAAMYCYNCSTSNLSSIKTVSTSCTDENPTEKCSKIGSGYASINFIGAEVPLDVEYEFAYTGDEKVITVPSTGKYKLEVWGAQGGEASSALGGYGGYAVGEVTLQKGTKLYINVGGKGGTRYYSSGYTAPGGYNGGANGYNNKTWGYVGAGGGATSIATASGLLKDVVSSQNKLLIVAGGGGGAFFYNNTYSTKNAGHGGGKAGVNCTSDSSTPGAGGTQDSNYGEGQAINATSGETPGGGGGYRGGETRYHCGGGGSGYIANSLLSNKKMVCYGCVEDANTNTKTISTSCVDETPTSDCAKINGGYVRITTVK